MPVWSMRTDSCSSPGLFATSFEVEGLFVSASACAQIGPAASRERRRVIRKVFFAVFICCTWLCRSQVRGVQTLFWIQKCYEIVGPKACKFGALAYGRGFMHKCLRMSQIGHRSCSCLRGHSRVA